MDSPRPEKKSLHFRNQLCPSRPFPNERQQHTSEPIVASTMTNGEKNGSEITSMKNKKKKNQSPGVNKVASDGISHNAPKKGRNDSEPGNANASRGSEVTAALQPATKKESQQQEKGRKKVFVLGDSTINGIEEKRLSHNHIVKVRKYPGDSTEDTIVHVKPIIRKSLI